MLDLIIKNGTVVNNDRSVQTDIGIAQGKIVLLGDAQLFPESTRVIDATGQYVLPGMIDSHVHVNQEVGEFASVDDFYDASLAAAHGGTTTMIDFAIPVGDESPLENLMRKQDEAKGRSLIDYAFHGCITAGNEANYQEVQEMLTGGVPTIKMFTVYRDMVMLEMGEIREVLKQVSKWGGLAKIHAESAEVIEYEIKRYISEKRTTPPFHAASRPPVAELQAVASILSLVEETGAPTLFVHMSSPQVKSLLRFYRARLPIYVEVCPHYLVLTDEVYHRSDGHHFVCCPPIRPAEMRDGLWELIEEGFVDVVNSDHSGYDSAQKEKYKTDFTRIPAGLPGIETRGLMLYSAGVAQNKISIEQFVDLTSTKVAKLMGLYPEKGVIRIGCDADLVVLDPDSSWEMTAQKLHMKSDYTPFEGLQVKGAIRYTIVGGELLIEQGKLVNERFRGKYLKRGQPNLN